MCIYEGGLVIMNSYIFLIFFIFFLQNLANPEDLIYKHVRHVPWVRKKERRTSISVHPGQNDFFCALAKMAPFPFFLRIFHWFYIQNAKSKKKKYVVHAQKIYLFYC